MSPTPDNLAYVVSELQRRVAELELTVERLSAKLADMDTAAAIIARAERLRSAD
jgi:uncharacterized small protein (DUF1192 family)